MTASRPVFLRLAMDRRDGHHIPLPQNSVLGEDGTLDAAELPRAINDVRVRYLLNFGKVVDCQG